MKNSIICREKTGKEAMRLEPGEIVSPGGLNHLPYLLSVSVSMAVIKDFSKNYMKAESSIYVKIT